MTYSAFLLVCLVLGVVLYASSADNARENFWSQQRMRYESSVSTMDRHLAALDNYARHLLNNSTFIRFANMKSESEYGFLTTAYEIRNTLSDRLFTLLSLPVKYSLIYLKNTDYVISGSQFTDVELYYRAYRKFRMDAYGDFLNILHDATGTGTLFDMERFTGVGGDLMLVRDLDAILPRSVPAVIWFEWNSAGLRELFLPPVLGEEAMLLCVDGAGDRQMAFGGSKAKTELMEELPGLSYNEAGFALFEKMHVMRCVSEGNGWTYYLALPESLCAMTLGNYDALFLTILLLALAGGGAMVFMLVRSNMRPIEQLGTQLRQSEGRRAQLEEVVDAQRATVCAEYVRKILSGHVHSEAELAYIMEYLGLNGQQMRYLALYCVVYNQNAMLDVPDTYEIIANELPAFLDAEYPAYFYSAAGNTYVVLCAYDQNSRDPLMDLQKRVLALHDRLLMEHSLWLYAGVGQICAQPISLWESFEQARMAARYTAKDHIFLPYEVMRKDAQSVYYPIEISAKLLHFITTGNKAQVVEMFSHIHRENIKERTLPINRLNFLLSDLRNTLLKARFSIDEGALSEDARSRLSEIDKSLSEQPTFPLCERTALEICPYFQEAAVPGDPIPEVKKYLRENFADRSLCLSKLSEHFNISESYLSHLFKDKTGENLSAYLETLRLTEAERRLKEDADCSLQTLYLEVGYNNAASFRRAFKKFHGVSPSAMRGV